MSTGSIIRISGPVVYAKGLAGAGLYDVVKVGAAGLIGEIINSKGTWPPFKSTRTTR